MKIIAPWLRNLVRKQSRYNINLDGRLSFTDNPEAFLHKFKKVIPSSNRGREIKIDLSNTKFIYPEALMFFICLKETIRKKKLLKICLEKGSQVHEYFDYAGFCTQFDVRKFPAHQQKTLTGCIFPLEVGQGSPRINYKATELVDFLKTKQDMSSVVEMEIIASIEEILNNILQHSEYTKYFLFGQAYPTSNRIRFVFYDNGMGIKSHIIKDGYDSKHKMFKEEVSKDCFEKIVANPANFAIETASKNFISATNYDKNSGAGINYLIEELLPISNGSLTILSEDGIVVWNKGRTITHNTCLPYRIKGTLISLTLDCEQGKTLVKS